MRRWILVLLLAVLPLQFAQASAAAYCAHEKTVAKQHMGHHEHEHQQTAAEFAGSTAGDTDSGPSGAADTDCGYCHLSSAQTLASVAPHWIATRERTAALSPTQAFASHDGDNVERPKWLAPARSAGSRESLIS